VKVGGSGVGKKDGAGVGDGADVGTFVATTTTATISDTDMPPAVVGKLSIVLTFSTTFEVKLEDCAAML
jgi:hypothetical protein